MDDLPRASKNVKKFGRGNKKTPSDFWIQVQKTKTCWVWKGRRGIRGYGFTKYNGRGWKTHRLAWFLVFGSIPNNLMVLHKCDNTSCVRPQHLFLGTQVDNMRDRDNKGRGPRGEANGMAKLTENDVISIRKRLSNPRYGDKISIMREFGIGRSALDYMLTRKNWSHI